MRCRHKQPRFKMLTGLISSTMIITATFRVMICWGSLYREASVVISVYSAAKPRRWHFIRYSPSFHTQQHYPPKMIDMKWCMTTLLTIHSIIIAEIAYAESRAELSYIILRPVGHIYRVAAEKEIDFFHDIVSRVALKMRRPICFHHTPGSRFIYLCPIGIYSSVSTWDYYGFKLSCDFDHCYETANASI